MHRFSLERTMSVEISFLVRVGASNLLFRRNSRLSDSRSRCSTLRRTDTLFMNTRWWKKTYHLGNSVYSRTRSCKTFYRRIRRMNLWFVSAREFNKSSRCSLVLELFKNIYSMSFILYIIIGAWMLFNRGTCHNSDLRYYYKKVKCTAWWLSREAGTKRNLKLCILYETINR